MRTLLVVILDRRRAVSSTGQVLVDLPVTAQLCDRSSRGQGFRAHGTQLLELEWCATWGERPVHKGLHRNRERRHRRQKQQQRAGPMRWLRVAPNGVRHAFAVSLQRRIATQPSSQPSTSLSSAARLASSQAEQSSLSLEPTLATA